MKAMKQLSSKLFLLLFYISTTLTWVDTASAAATQHIQRGFSVSPDTALTSKHFQPLLFDTTGNFSLGFLRVDSAQLDLAVLHLPSSQPLWRANPGRSARWTGLTTLSFNGSLVLSDPETGVLWSTQTDGGDRLVLLNSSNLQIQKLTEPISVLWQSFDFPSDTLVQDQNLTATAALFSTNGRFSMSLGINYLTLRMEFGEVSKPMYWKHTALEAKAQIVYGEGAIYARVDPVGFLGMYQNEKAPVDVLSFDSFNRGITGFRRLALESDGNLRAYYWNGSIWVSDFEAISNACELPSTCGQYGLCSSEQPRCGCLDNSTKGCFPAASGDLCGKVGDDFWVLRRKGVDLANKELLGFEKMGSLEECEGSCDRNCSCWGAVYNNASGFCYRVDYPIQMVVEVRDERKVGYFKVRKSVAEARGRRRVVLLLIVGLVIFSGAAGFGVYRVWNQRKRRMRAGLEGSIVEGLSPGPYRGLSSSSFRSIELSLSFKK